MADEKLSPEQLAEIHVSRYPKARCARCDCPYGSHGFHDLIVPDDVWRQISPTGDEGGLLCPTCIVAAVNDLGLTEVPAYFASGPLSLTTDAQAQHALDALADCQEGLEKTEQQIESLTAERDRLRAACAAPTHDANDYNCQDWPPGTGCTGCEGDKLRAAALTAAATAERDRLGPHMDRTELVAQRDSLNAECAMLEADCDRLREALKGTDRGQYHVALPGILKLAVGALFEAKHNTLATELEWLRESIIEALNATDGDESE